MKATTYCRICSAICGLTVEVEDGRATRIQGDLAHPLSRGFTCVKGRRQGDFHTDPARFLTSMKRSADGTLVPIPAEQAIAEIGDRLLDIFCERGPDAIGLFIGTQTYTATLTWAFAHAWFRAIGSRKLFMTMSIDQQAKTLTPQRLGAWAGGRQRFEDADVWLFAGTNPLVSMQGGDLTGYPVAGGPRALREAKTRGMTVIVVDPRRTELADYADIYLQLIPGSDAVLFAGMLRVILEAGLEDAAFCAAHVNGLADLRAALAGATPQVVAARTGLEWDDVVRAARAFARASRGMAVTGTGPDMGPFANVAEHLASCLNVVCGRFPREGDRHAHASILHGAARATAEVIPPSRAWEQGYRSRFGWGQVGGDLPAASMAGEILEPGEDRLRALIVSGGNPANAIPDQGRTVRALSELDLLVAIEPFPTETARLAHYVIAPAMPFERSDMTRPYEKLYSEPFAQYTPPVLPRPPGVIEDWELFFGIADRMGFPITIGERVFAPGDRKPDAEELLASFAERSRVPLDEVKAHPHGRVFDEVAPVRVGSASGRGARFELLPDDVASELAEALAAPAQRLRLPDEALLVCRRDKETMNSLGRRTPGLPRAPFNPLGMHPDQMAAAGLGAGDLIRITSDWGEAVAVAEADERLRPGVVAITHAYGDLPGDDGDARRFGTNPARLLSSSEKLQAITGMPWMSAVPVRLARA